MNGIQVFLAAYAQPLIWLAVALVMLIIEAATVQMVSIWFCLGAVAAAIAAWFHPGADCCICGDLRGNAGLYPQVCKKGAAGEKDPYQCR